MKPFSDYKSPISTYSCGLTEFASPDEVFIELPIEENRHSSLSPRRNSIKSIANVDDDVGEEQESIRVIPSVLKSPKIMKI